MLIRTHLAVAVFAILLFINSVESRLLFVVVTLIATFIPDIDSRFSTIGRRKIARVLQWFTKHRGMIHSFTFLLSITFLLILIIPSISFGFFLGYGLHLFVDCFTKEGIQGFYPIKKRTSGIVSTGGKIEVSVLVLFIFLDIIFLGIKIF